MSVEIYKGKYVTAEDANKYIDCTSIVRGCNIILEGLKELHNSMNDLNNAKSNYSKNVLHLKNRNYEGKVDDSYNVLNSTYNYMEDFSRKVYSALQKALDKKQLELNEIARAEDLRVSSTQSL